MSRFAIVVIGYNRIDSLQRLMDSLLLAEYDEKVDLIVSLDHSGNNNVECYAKTIVWPYGNKNIRTFSKRLGLKNHVLTCGGYIDEYGYDAIIVLEDDLFVAPGFFNFAKQAVQKYENNDTVAGISLYTHSWNLNADRPFQAVYKGYDIFFIQYPQSWGQVWMKKQWNEFHNWYITKQYEIIDRDKIPDNVLEWPETSWLKYHIEYCITAEKFFVYPYHSLTTNYADAGTHYAFSTNKMQIPLDMSRNSNYLFPDNMNDTSIYDSFYESRQLVQMLGVEKGGLEVDLFNMKKKYSTECQFLLSTERKNFKVVKAFGLQMRPWELNVIYQVPGKEIFLYDMKVFAKAPKLKHKSLIHWVYDTRCQLIMKQNFLDIIVNEVFSKLRKNR